MSSNFNDLMDVVNSYADELSVSENKGWVKVSSSKKEKVYLQKKEKNPQVHVSNWESDLESGLVPAPKKNGRVTQWIDPEFEDKTSVLSNLLEELLTRQGEDTTDEEIETLSEDESDSNQESEEEAA